MAKGLYNDWVKGEGLERVREWVAEGVEDRVIAKERIGISRTTLYQWRQDYPDFADAFKKSRAVFYDTSNQEVINAVLNRATGYSYKETTRELREVDGEMQMVITKEVTKHMPADMLAALSWVQNRIPDEWRDRRNVAGQQEDGKGEVGVALIPEVKED